ncbi:MAG TPA: hypothetical protein VKD90_12740, partial [Gemmataceae bacterium]|nr:hypothetical protein [Gemmataceae bacterium]
EHFFDGFGFYLYLDKFGWSETSLDRAEEARKLQKPLLPFLAKLNDVLPKKWDRHRKQYRPNDDWLLWDLRKADGGAAVREVHQPPAEA